MTKSRLIQKVQLKRGDFQKYGSKQWLIGKSKMTILLNKNQQNAILKVKRGIYVNRYLREASDKRSASKRIKDFLEFSRYIMSLLWRLFSFPER